MNWKILYKYVQGNCSEGELRRLGDWLQEDPANEDFFTTFIEEWNGEEIIGFESDARAAWEEFRKKSIEPDIEDAGHYTRLSGRLVRPTEKRYASINKKHRRGVRYWSYSIAAALLLVLAVVFVIQQFNNSVNTVREQVPSYQEISTVRGQRTNLKLSDGSKVVLNASSTLRIPKDYGRETRTLYLEGEAFFEVDHDEENPFIVISHGTYTKDLGTQFNVMAYDSTHIEVAVKEGLVSMGWMDKDSPEKELVELTPNKLAVLKDLKGLTVSDIEHIDQYVGWAEGKLVFQSTPFPEVVERLERWFDIDCKIEVASSELYKRTLTATYNNMPMTEVLKVLSISMDVSYNREGRTVTFFAEKGKSI